MDIVKLVFVADLQRQNIFGEKNCSIKIYSHVDDFFLIFGCTFSKDVVFFTRFCQSVTVPSFCTKKLQPFFPLSILSTLTIFRAFLNKKWTIRSTASFYVRLLMGAYRRAC